MLLKFDNPANGRFYYMVLHFEGEKIVLTTFRGGKKKKVLENLIFETLPQALEVVKIKKKRRIKNGYHLANASLPSLISII